MTKLRALTYSRTTKERRDVSRADVSKALVVCAFVSFLHCMASLFGFEQSDLTLHEDMTTGVILMTLASEIDPS